MAEALRLRIEEDVKSAMRARERERLGVLRLVTAAIKQREIDEHVTLDDAGVLAVLDKMLKQRRDSLGHYEDAGRDDLAAQERFEIELIQAYMPAALGPDELAQMIDAAIAQTGAETMKDMGKVMGRLKSLAQGRRSQSGQPPGQGQAERLTALLPSPRVRNRVRGEG